MRKVNRIHICPTCNLEFKAKRKNSIYCSIKCMHIAKKGIPSQLKGIDRVEKIICNCENCNKELKLSPWEYNRAKHHFCSKECHHEGSVKLGLHSGGNNKNPHLGFITVKCNCCEKDITKRVSLWNANKSKTFYCSKECRGYFERYKMELGIHQLLGSKRHKGKDNKLWNGGLMHIIKDVRRSIENLRWKDSCLLRDNKQCVICGDNKSLTIHHKVPLAYFIRKYNIQVKEDARGNEEIYDIDNGVTLCKSCHHNFHTKYGKAYFSKDDFTEFINDLKLEEICLYAI